MQRVVFDGPRLIPLEDLQALARPLEGRTVTADEIETLREDLTRRIIDRGYLASGAIIPPNALHDGELHIQLVPGYLADVEVHGQERLRPNYIRKRLLGDPTEPLKLSSLQERYQLLLGDPLIKRMQGRILPGESAGLAVLDVTVERARPYQVTLIGDNYRPPSIGAEAFGLNAWVRNLTGWGDLLDFTFTTGAGSRRYSGGWRVPMNDAGTEAYIRFDEGDSGVIEESFKNVNIESQIHSLEGGISHALVNTLQDRFALGLSFGIRANETTIAGLPVSFVTGNNSGKTQATVLRLNQDYLHRWDHDAVVLRSIISVGMLGLGSTPRTGRASQSSEFFAWLGQVQYAHRFNNDAQWVFRFNTQFSDAPLLPLERIAVGGVGTVRGYRENELVRDEGYTLALEYIYPLVGGPNDTTRLSLVPFMDYGEGWNHGEAADALHSVGLGLAGDYRRLHAEFYYGYAINSPLSNDTGDLQDHGIHFQVRLDAF